MYVVVGLGNPGSKYEHTRHNAGFDVVTLLADRLGIKMDKLKCKAVYGEGRLAGEKIVLAQPQTFMNLSGESVTALVNWFKVDMDHLIVVYDDIDLPLGRLRMREKGSAGTHNGMRSIIYLLGRDDFPRVRMGVGAPPPQWDLADWVLSRYETPEDRQTAFDAMNAAGDVICTFITRGPSFASQQATLYGKPPKAPKEERGGGGGVTPVPPT